MPNGPECLGAVRSALELGYRHIDTAQADGNEKSVGRALVTASTQWRLCVQLRSVISSGPLLTRVMVRLGALLQAGSTGDRDCGAAGA